MCHTTIPEQMPLTTANGSMGAPGTPSLDANGMPTGAQPTGAGAADALSQSVAAGNPTSATVSMPTGFGRAMELATGGAFDPTGGEDTTTPPTGKLTKFGALVRVVGPMLEGGLIGLAGGKGHPQGGFGAANDFYQRQRAYQMQRLMLQRQALNDQFKNLLDYARTQHELTIPPMTRVPGAIKGKDAQGNDIYMAMNPRTMQYEPVQGITPESNPDYTQVGTDKGIVLYDKRGTAPTRPLTLPTGAPQGIPADEQPGPDGNGPTSIPNRLPSQFDSGSPRRPGSANQSPGGIAAAAAGAIPLRPPGFGTPKPIVRASRNASGYETDYIYDENPDSPTFGKRIASTGNTRAPLPDRPGARRDQDDQASSQIESYAAEALGQTGNDPDKAIALLNGLKNTDPKVQQKYMALLPKIRQRVRERSRQGKRRLNLSPAQAQSVGAVPTNPADVDDEDNQ